MNAMSELNPIIAPSAAANGTTTPWYRDPYRWLVIMFPLAAVIGGIITLVLAVQSFDGLVVDDYYNRGLAVNRVLSRDARAAAYGLSTTLHWDRAAQQLAITLKANAQFVRPEQLNIEVIYATRADHDRHVIAHAVGNDQYQVTLPGLAPGHWYVHVAHDDWRINDSFFLRD